MVAAPAPPYDNHCYQIAVAVVECTVHSYVRGECIIELIERTQTTKTKLRKVVSHIDNRNALNSNEINRFIRNW